MSLTVPIMKPLTMKKWLLSFGALALLLVATTALAQSGDGYDLPWYTIDSGGGSAIQSGAYTWGGTAGQPDAGTLTEGTYTFRGGFWGGVFSPVDYTSTQSGAWSSGGTWDQLAAPAYDAVVTISAGDTVTVSAAAACYRLTVEHGATLVLAEGATLTVGETVSNAGTLQQTQPVSATAGTVVFLAFGDHRGVELTTPNDLGPVTVTVRTLASGEYCTADGAASPPYADRCFRIQPTHDLSATVRLWALASEIGFSGIPAVFHNPGGTDVWTELTTGAANGTVGDYIYAEAETSSFSYFLIAQTSQGPTMLGLHALLADTSIALVLFGLLLGVGVSLLLHKRRQ